MLPRALEQVVEIEERGRKDKAREKMRNRVSQTMKREEDRRRQETSFTLV